ncbi:pseudaminic acid synthase [Oceanimonas sp. MB9]|uniref:pseudaminic acid synthase n=1 Tax=Oceanimonas sp. MB9 TaxID=2588453 RepID=UPI0013F62552|nr:pseudaminic acid synthase [Oceanimonas sp. MB9]NHI01614.1 Pseudaminic acid synthase [Oceanimonas sp. MB9]
MSNSFDIANRKVGEGEPVYIISELSANHLHNLDYALKIVEISAACGVDAIKIQTLTADTMTINCDKPEFIAGGGTIWDGRKLYDLYSETPLPYEWHDKIFNRAQELGIDCFSTPYDLTALEFLDQFDMPAYKVSSFEIADIPLIEAIAKKGKPVIISTGIAELKDIQEAVDACYRQGNNQVALLKCTSAYPAPYSSLNLKTIPNLKNTFGVVSGLSDHTLGIEVPVAAVALGASIVEKHVTLDRSLGGPDAEFSLEPDELKQMVNSIRNIEQALGKVSYSISDRIRENRIRFGRSLYFVRDIEKGQIISKEDVRSIRPGYGLPPKYMNDIVGKKATKNIERGTAVKWSFVNE